MSIFSAIAGALFGGPKTAEKTVDFVTSSVQGVGKWIDHQQFTDEEKSAVNLKAGDMMLKAIEKTRHENSTQSVTRRYLAWTVMGAFILLILASAVAYPFSPQYAEYLFKLAENSRLGWLAAGVGGFYFLAHVIRAGK